MWPKDNKKQVSAAVRILQQKRDASARATHLKATDGIVPSVTIERKIMSTKTSIKRIALVAAAALALGGFSAVSASAASVEGTAVTSLGLAASSGNTGVVNAAYVVNVGAVTVATAVQFCIAAALADTAENPPMVNAAAATSATRLIVVFVDICFLSIVEDWTIQFSALR